MAYCKSKEPETGKSFTYQITTNAVLMTNENISFLVEHNFSVMLSIDGPPEKSDIHRKDLGGNGVAATAIANAKRLVSAQKKAKIRPAMIRATMTHENHDSAALYAYF